MRDKDGISAAVDMLGLLSELAANGQTLDQHLAEFAEKFGAFASSQISIRVSDLAEIPRTMAALRLTPPASIGGVRVLEIDDFVAGLRDVPAQRPAALPARGRRTRDRAPERNRAQAQVLPRHLVDGWHGGRARRCGGALLAKLDAGMRELLVVANHFPDGRWPRWSADAGAEMVLIALASLSVLSAASSFAASSWVSK